MDATNRIEDLIMITDRLADVLERENDALLNRRNSELHELLDEKVTLSRVYETRMQVIAEKPEILADIDADVRERLTHLGERIDALMEDNRKLLKTAIDANRRVVDLIAEAARGAAPGPGTYGAQGSTSQNARRTESQSVSISLDQTL
jgi:hypothetical protein